MKEAIIKGIRTLSFVSTSTPTNYGHAVPLHKRRYVYCIKYNDTSGAINDITVNQRIDTTDTVKDRQRLTANDTKAFLSKLEDPILILEGGSFIRTVSTGTMNVTISYYEI